DDERSVLVSEMFAHRIGLIDDSDLDQLIGKPLRLELPAEEEDGPSFNVSLSGRAKGGGGRDEQMALRQLAWQLPEALAKLSPTGEEIAARRKAIEPKPPEAVPGTVADNFRVAGIFRELNEEEKKDAWSHIPANTDLVLPRRTAVDLTFRDP